MAKILVIDDSESALALFKLFLTNAGHDVIARQSSKGAVQLAAESAADLVITDIYMPEEDGLEVIAEARRICPTIPIVAVTGVGAERDMLKAAKCLGAALTLKKPFSERQLIQIVSGLLATRRHPRVVPHRAAVPISKGGPT